MSYADNNNKMRFCSESIRDEKVNKKVWQAIVLMYRVPIPA